MIPFRRREFEADAMIHEVVRRASTAPHIHGGSVHRAVSSPGAVSHVCWGSVLPASRSVAAANLGAARSVRIIADRPALDAVVAELSATLADLSPAISFTGDVESASHVLVLLTGCVLAAGSASEVELQKSAALNRDMVFVYSEDHGWDFGTFYNSPESAVKATIAGNEALVLRPKGQREFEHQSMSLEMLRRMRVR